MTLDDIKAELLAHTRTIECPLCHTVYVWGLTSIVHARRVRMWRCVRCKVTHNLADHDTP
jgi:hypothetical protein